MTTTKDKKMKKKKVLFVTEEQIDDQLSKGREILTDETDGKRRGKGKKLPTHITSEEEIQRKIDEGLKIIENEKRKLIEDEKKKKQKVVHTNPPTVIFTDDLMISVYKGCTRKKITCEEITYLHNMVFQRYGILGYYKNVLNKFINGEYNVHFHLKKSCLQNANQSLEFKDITMTDEVLTALSSEQMAILKDADILQCILMNKQKQVSNGTE